MMVQLKANLIRPHANIVMILSESKRWARIFISLLTIIMTGQHKKLLYQESVSKELKFKYFLKLVTSNKFGNNKIWYGIWIIIFTLVCTWGLRFPALHLIIFSAESDKIFISLADDTTGDAHVKSVDERKLFDHIDSAVVGVESCRADVIWNMYLGLAPVCSKRSTSSSQGEVSLEDEMNKKFQPLNPLTWDQSTLENIEQSFKESGSWIKYLNLYFNLIWYSELNVDCFIGLFVTARDDVAALLIKSVLNHLQTKYKSRFALDVGEVAGHKSKGRVHLLSLVQYYML